MTMKIPVKANPPFDVPFGFQIYAGWHYREYYKYFLNDLRNGRKQLYHIAKGDEKEMR